MDTTLCWDTTSIPFEAWHFLLFSRYRTMNANRNWRWAFEEQGEGGVSIAQWFYLENKTQKHTHTCASLFYPKKQFEGNKRELMTPICMTHSETDISLWKNPCLPGSIVSRQYFFFSSVFIFRVFNHHYKVHSLYKTSYQFLFSNFTGVWSIEKSRRLHSKTIH